MLKRKDFWFANDGNVWIIGLFILQILLMICINFNLNLDHLLKINKIDPTFECVKIKVIQRIKEEFRTDKMEDFEIEIDGYKVKVYYSIYECDVYFEGEHNVHMKVIYDEVFLSIGSVEYDFEEWEY